MKKILLIAAMAIMVLLAASCKDGEFVVSYNVDVVGDADGNVAVTFPDGTLKMEGTAALSFHYGNAPTGIAPLSLSDAMTSNDAKVVKAAKAVSEDYAKKFKVIAASGTYYFHVGGYAEAYGVKISIDETLTNRKND